MKKWKKSITQKTFIRQNNEKNNKLIYNFDKYFIYRKDINDNKIIKTVIQIKHKDNPSNPNIYEIFKNEKE